ncbi:MAG: two-component regulator propeller domain-containing protein, partial [Acidobacteriota bacterium]
AAVVFIIIWINSRIAAERAALAEAARVDVRQTALRAPAAEGMIVYLNASDVRATVEFKGARFLATSGGLIALDAAGSVRKRYTTMDGLADNDLTAMAVFREKLFIGTASTGLMSFDGEAFTAFRFEKPKATRVSYLLSTASELFIGTLDGGLFEYDGERFSRRLNSATGADFRQVTALLASDSRVYIGTQAAGLYVWREAQIDHIEKNLPSPRVTGLSLLPDGDIAVATDFGVVSINESNEIKPLSNQPNVTSLATIGGRLWAGLFNGGVKEIDRGEERKVSDSQKEVVGLPRLAPATVYSDEEGLWALTREGAFVREERAAGPRFKSVAGALAGSLTAGHITSLAFDEQGRLWIGYFDRGIDVLSVETGERIAHIEDDRVREVNFIASREGVYVATSRGLAVFAGSMTPAVMTRERSGLISDAVAHVLFTEGPRGRSVVCATAGGMTEISGGRARSLTAFHGLASNHLYSATASGSRVFLGSLAGLVELEGLRVTRTYKTSNSKLSHDWVTALVEDEGTIYVGTNGGGVDALTVTGEWINFSDELGRFEVNQNAMHRDGERIYVGTTDRGLLVYNTRGRRWGYLSAGLPSQNVTAIASDESFIYIGTLNGLARIEKRVIN